MEFLTELLVEGIKFVVLILIAVGGIFAGIGLRKAKDKKEDK